MIFLIRTDSSKTIGSGHVMRSLSLAEKLIEEGHQVFCVYCQMLPELLTRMRTIGVKAKPINCEIGSSNDISATLNAAGMIDPAAIIIDGYEFEEQYLRKINTLHIVVYIDDLSELENISADLIVNASPVANASYYRSSAPNSKILLGPEYVMMRREFINLLNKIEPVDNRDNILITFGGTDPAGLTKPVVMRLLEKIPPTQIVDVVVSNNLDVTFPENVKLHIKCDYMSKLMLRAGLAISAGGSTVFELAAMKIPSLLVIVANNQQPFAKWATENKTNVVIDARDRDIDEVTREIVGKALELNGNFQKKCDLIEKNKNIIGTNGVSKIVVAIENIIKMGNS